MDEDILTLRALLFENEGRYVLQLVDRDICVQASSEEELHERLIATIHKELEIGDLRGDVSPLSGILPAPGHFLKTWEDLEASGQVGDVYLDHLSLAMAKAA